MATNKTKANKQSVAAFLNGVENDKRRSDAKKIARLMKTVTGYKPRMWGSSIVGYGQYHYKYDSGREGDFMRVGFSPRKQNLVLYIISGFKEHDSLMKKLGKHKTGKSCLYINKLEDIDLSVLEKLIRKSMVYMDKKYPK
ncbi:MAG: DUF1801 domain-containing protein [Gammaproteobacteria bacterium]|nr:DUF1801 domain-containing protein [Gammaproteobacteria bacterium]